MISFFEILMEFHGNDRISGEPYSLERPQITSSCVRSLWKRFTVVRTAWAFLLAAGFSSSAYSAAPGCIGFAAVDGDSNQGMSIAGGTVGGAGGTTVSVSTQAALENALDQTEPQVIRIQGMISITPWGKTENVPSNTTLLGTGCGSGILNGHLVLDTASNVILQNLFLGGSYVPGDPDGNCCNWDAITIWHSSHHIWVDHCDLSHTEDGLCDISDKSSYITVSWCRFHDQNKVSLVGSSDSKTSDIGYLKVTYHHNWFDYVLEQSPRLRFGMIHLFNNYYTHIGQYCVWDTMGGQMTVENNYFGSGALNPHVIGTPTPTYQPLLSAANNYYDPTATGSQETFGTSFSPATFYSYVLDPVGAVPNEALTGTGPCGNLATPTPTPIVGVSTVWRIRCGGMAVSDSAGNAWAADTQYLGGYSYPATAVLSVAGTSDPSLYQTERYGDLFNADSFSYSFPVPAGAYQVTLKFAETDFTGTGSRIFNVNLNGTAILSNFDLYADAGGADRADDKVFSNVVPVSGLITVQFNAGGADSPKVNAIQVVPMGLTSTPTATYSPTFTPSPTTTATPPAPSGAPYVYSNPSSGPTVHFVYTMGENGTATIKVWNASGVLAAQMRNSMPSGIQQSSLDVRSFAPGHYFYQVDLKYDSGREQLFHPEVLAIRR